ncbi:hypothetical protein Tco_0851456, partial [Tanacetum coccineum]
EREVTDKRYSMMTMLIQHPKEIIAKYRKVRNDASSAAEEARNKLLEPARNYQVEIANRINRRTQDLSNKAEDFASLA